MAIFVGRRPDGSWDNLDAGPIDCLADMLAAFRGDGLVIVDILRTRKGAQPGERLIAGRTPALISPQRYAAIENATIRFVEADDV